MDVLIVDDEKPVLRCLAVCVLKLGHNVRQATSYNEAVLEIEKKAPDLIISDYHMKGKSGAELLAFTLSMENPIPFSVISGFLSNEEIEFIEKETYGFIPKPFTVTDIKEILDKVEIKNESSSS